jgi:hypothetical protein
MSLGKNCPSRPYGPHSNSNANPATAVGIAVGIDMITMIAFRPQNEYRDKTYAANIPKIILKTVAQKLVTKDNFNANIASGSTSAFQKLVKPLLVQNIKIDASGRRISGNMIATSTPTLSGLITSKPRVCLTPETFALMFSNATLPA